MRRCEAASGPAPRGPTLPHADDWRQRRARCRRHAVAPPCLGSVERLVGTLQGARQGIGRGVPRQANGYLVTVMGSSPCGTGTCMACTAPQALRRATASAVGGRTAADTNSCPQRASTSVPRTLRRTVSAKLLQHQVASGMPVGVVDDFEVVNAAGQSAMASRCAGCGAAPAACDRGVARRFSRPGQVIVRGQLADLLQRPRQFGLLAAQVLRGWIAHG